MLKAMCLGPKIYFNPYARTKYGVPKVLSGNVLGESNLRAMLK